jgi:hypothetical protein
VRDGVSFLFLFFMFIFFLPCCPLLRTPGGTGAEPEVRVGVCSRQ